VGYVSPDFRQHAVAFFMAPILTQHDHRVVEVHCYVDQRNNDDTSSQLRRHADHWTMIAGQPDEAVVQRIRQDGIDILVDLAGYTAGSRLGVFARQAAPIQVTYLGYPNTTGLPTIQYRITDRWADPPGETEHLHSEELIRPSSSFLCYAPPTGCPDVVEPPVVQGGRITFGSFNRGRKITDLVVSLWSRLLRELPSSRLLLKPGPVDRAALRARFSAHGVGADRIDIVAYSASILHHFADYGSIDVALDTFPYHGTTTTCDAMWMGVPVVTLAGHDHRSRVGVSLLRSTDLAELIAETPDEYVERALGLAQNPDRLRQLRAAQRGVMLRSPLMDAQSFTRALEAAYREMWVRWCSERRAR
jgi:protein O-GlcNAc transferase